MLNSYLEASYEIADKGPLRFFDRVSQRTPSGNSWGLQLSILQSVICRLAMSMERSDNCIQVTHLSLCPLEVPIINSVSYSSVTKAVLILQLPLRHGKLSPSEN